MFVPAVALLAIVVVLPRVPAMKTSVVEAGARFVQTAAYRTAVLDGRNVFVPAQDRAMPYEVVPGLISTAGAIGLALLALFPGWLAVGRPGAAVGRALHPVRRLQSGHAGDYVAWLTFGVAVFGGLFAFLLRR